MRDCLLNQATPSCLSLCNLLVQPYVVNNNETPPSAKGYGFDEESPEGIPSLPEYLAHYCKQAVSHMSSWKDQSNWPWQRFWRHAKCIVSLLSGVELTGLCWEIKIWWNWIMLTLRAEMISLFPSEQVLCVMIHSVAKLSGCPSFSSFLQSEGVHLQ